MVISAYELREVFASIWNVVDSRDAFVDTKITENAKWNAKRVANFLESAASII